MEHKERFARALRLETLDRMPHSEQMIHDSLVAKITRQSLPDDDGNALFKWMNMPMTDENFSRHVAARKFMDFDHVQVFPMEPFCDCGTSAHGNRLVRDVWGATLELTDESTIIIQKPIEDVRQAPSYEFPAIEAFGFENIRRWVEEDSFFVAPQVDTGYFKIHQLVGFEEYMEGIYTYPNQIHALMKKFVDFQIALIDKLIDMGADGIWLSDDHAYNSGPFIAPHMLEEFDFSYMKQVVNHIHSRRRPVVLHSCGNLNQTIELLIATGVDGLHAIQPSAHNDIYAYKKKYGDKLCLIGNLDINYLLPEGSPAQIRAKVEEMAQNLFYDKKGFVLSTCNLLNLDVPVENAITMHLTASAF